MSQIPAPLQELSRRLNSAEGEQRSEFMTPRELLAWFGKFRRTWRQVSMIRDALNSSGLSTFPDFEGAGIDDPIRINLVIDSQQSKSATSTSTTTPDPNDAPATTSELSQDASAADVSGISVDPVHRVSRFLAGTKPVSVTRDEALCVAVTQMMLHNYSQLPVMQGERKVDGMISWQSIGQLLALGAKPVRVSECMEPHHEVTAETSIFDAITIIQNHQCVLVRSADNKVSGILTAADISTSFEQLSRPFLLLSYIENHLRSLIGPRFSVSELQSAKDPADTERVITGVASMTFGEYIRLLENPTKWEKLDISIERSLFINQLNDVREIRNDVMHFNPEGIEEEDLETLRKFDSFLQSILHILAKREKVVQ